MNNRKNKVIEEKIGLLKYLRNSKNKSFEAKENFLSKLNLIEQDIIKIDNNLHSLLKDIINNNEGKYSEIDKQNFIMKWNSRNE